MVYPGRILDAPQPPDGPRQWLTPLAFLRWHPRAPASRGLPAALREPGPAGAFGRIVHGQDRAAGCGRRMGVAGRDRRPREPCPPDDICLNQARTRYGGRCGSGRGTDGSPAGRSGPAWCCALSEETAPRFARGLITAEDTDGLSLQDLEIHPAQVPFVLGPEVYAHLPERARELLAAHRHRQDRHRRACHPLHQPEHRGLPVRPPRRAPAASGRPRRARGAQAPQATRTCSPWPSSARRRYRACGSCAAPSPSASRSSMRVTTEAQ